MTVRGEETDAQLTRGEDVEPVSQVLGKATSHGTPVWDRKKDRSLPAAQGGSHSQALQGEDSHSHVPLC